MSRSYKKNPVVKDHNSGRYGKTTANRKLRRCRLDPAGKSKQYKKYFNSWNIHDYSSRWSLEEILAEWENENSWVHKKCKTKEECVNFWKKEMIRK